ncbi:MULTISPECIES: hypothetical protein [Sulfitobacter]|jgi:ABC-type dipeptide/oligopeptide/nickel transport system permease subunit|uniref:Uncharacterized protein n=2 Tax=Sulfitobacter TaxID=60136 RepID=A0A1H2ULG5_9RHOB|nr:MULTISPECIES: hypothetical protein [Sulfitobacter]MAJ78222.1 hypothetical protein [Roseobacter sp.]NKX48624.1 hypothetical protein [Rhodobacteraceae bacterium R_SAG8]AXI50871.1 hypothetical protein C1J04_08080 [Sulfitobacter sp. SK025]EAP80491.1 hypothetical protein NAS141_18299 [Sulfitobacter sp. NAS-14.1]KAJ31712.1 hypothetical protein PM01_00775 [Sulfitobacter pontiacus 3SOLIMAR09]|tara:strand:+ start:662 stop:934 length:273 start_codon:yes stop_codon:yes gene_type:complete
MSKPPGSPLFLERRSYRFRRMMDAVRLLPLLVLAFWMVPLLWPVQDAPVGAAVPMSHALRYVFGVWLAGIVLCFLLWRRTARQIAQEAQD